MTIYLYRDQVNDIRTLYVCNKQGGGTTSAGGISYTPSGSQFGQVFPIPIGLPVNKVCTPINPHPQFE